MELKTGNSVMTQGGVERVLASNYTLGSVLLLSCILRIWHVMSLRSLPLFNRLIVDSEVYDQWAQYIAAGHWLGGDRAFYMDPLYPYVLAIIYKFFGHDLLLVRLLQAGLGGATCALVAIIGQRISSDKAVGTLAAFLLAIYGPAIFQDGEIEKTTLGVFLITAALATAICRFRFSCFYSGVFLALATLTRGNLVLLMPLGALYLFIDSGQQFEHEVNSLKYRDRFVRRLTGKQGQNALVYILGIVVMLTPVLVRNYYVSGEWILTTSQAGQNFYTGNNPFNDVGAYRPLPFVRPQSLYEEADFHAKAESLTGKKLSPVEVSSFWFREATKHIIENPLYASAVFIRKFCLFWSNVEVADTWDFYFLKRYSSVLNLPLLNFGLLLTFSAIGAVAFYKSYDGVRLIVGFITAYSITVIAFFIFSRYRIHVVPPLAVLSALGLLWMRERIVVRDYLKLLQYSSLATLVFVFSFMGASTFGYFAREHVNSYSLLAEMYRKNGDFISAEVILKDAQQKFNNDPSTSQALGLLYLSKKDPETALFYFKQCILVDETYPDAWFLYGVAHESLGNISEAIKSYQRQLAYIHDHESSINRLSILK